MNESISVAEIIKMLKDHNMFPKLMHKEDVQSLVKLIAVKMESPNILALDFE